jgi:hypothetical protein
MQVSALKEGLSDCRTPVPIFNPAFWCLQGKVGTVALAKLRRLNPSLDIVMQILPSTSTCGSEGNKKRCFDALEVTQVTPTVTPNESRPL